MNRINKTILLSLMFSLLSLNSWGLETTSQQVFLKNVFTPVGWDDNDEVEAMVDGELPNACYELLATQFVVDHFSKTIILQQMAQRKNTPSCQEGSLTAGDIFSWPVPFTQKVTLGKLSEGRYTIEFYLNENQMGRKDLVVKKSSSQTIDDVIYAPVSSVFLPEMIYETSNAEIVLTGIRPSPCLKLKNENIKVLKYGEVIVVLPVVEQIEDSGHCEYHPIPLHQVVSLGALRPGRYFLHVRSMTGKSINKVFTVIERPFDPSMESKR